MAESEKEDSDDQEEILEALEEDLVGISNDAEVVKDCVEVIKFYKNKYGLSIAALWRRILLAESTESDKVLTLVQIMDDVLLEETNDSFKTKLSPEAFILAKDLLPKLEPKTRRHVIRIFGIWELLGLFSAPQQAKFIAKVLEEVEAESEDEGESGEPGPPNADGKRAAPQDAPQPKKPKTEKEEVRRILNCDQKKPLDLLELSEVEDLTAAMVRKSFRKLSLIVHPDKNRDKTVTKADLEKAFALLQEARVGAEKIVEERAKTGRKTITQVSDVAEEDRCKFPGCQHAAMPKCSNNCCALLIKHCQTLKGRKNCFFHPPPVKR